MRSPVRVHLTSVAPLEGAAYEEVVGSVKAKLHATLEARVAGRIARMPVQLGDAVKAGALIAELDIAELRAKLAQADAAARQADSDLKRARPLLDSQSISSQEFDAIEARARLSKATVDETRALVGYARVTAPFAGVVTGKFAEVGDLANPGKPLAELEDPGALRLEVNIAEALLGRVKVGQSLPVRIESAPEVKAASVAEIAPTADPNSRTFLVKLDLPVSRELRAGLFGRALLSTATTQVLRVPASSVLQRGQMQVVFVGRDTHAELRLVKTGKRVGDDVEILSGLAASERVIANPPVNLVDETPIEVMP